MKGKRWLASLLVLVLCMQMLPITAWAVGTYTIEVAQASGGQASITADDDSLAVVDNKVTGIKNNTQFVTVTAVPEEGYQFAGWTVKAGTQESGNYNTNATGANYTLGIKTEGGKYTLADNPVKISISTAPLPAMRKDLQLTPQFVKPIQVMITSSDASKGTVSSTTENLTEYVPGTAIALSAVPKENCTFSGWTVAYTDGSGSVPTSDYTLTNNTLTLTSNVTKNVTVTGHFLDAGDPNFVIPGKEPTFSVASGSSTLGTVAVTGWNNDLGDTIEVTVSGVAASALADGELMIYTANPMNKTDLLMPEGLTFAVTDFDSSLTFEQKQNTNQVPYWSLSYIAEEHEISFTVTDARSNTKNGIIKLQFNCRGVVSAEHGTVTYNDETYADGDFIDFTKNEATITATAGANYTFANWDVSGTTLQNNAANPLTFTVPSAYFTITANFTEGARETYSIEVVQSVEHGSATIKDQNGVLAEDGKVDGLYRRGPNATVEATPDEEYALSTWKISRWNDATSTWVELTNGIMVMQWTSWTPGNLTNPGPVEIGVGGATVNQSASLKLEPVFVPGVAVTRVSSNEEWGTVSTVSPMPDIVAPGSKWTLTAEPKSGYLFDHWEVTYTDGVGTPVSGTDYTLAPSSNGTAALTIPENTPRKGLTVTAVFVEIKPVTATVTAEHGSVRYGSTSATTGETIEFLYSKDMVSITAVPDDGYAFSHWEISGVDLGVNYKSPSLNFYLPAEDFTITAVFLRKLTFQVMNGSEDLTDKTMYGGLPVVFYSFDNGTSFDDAVADSSKRTALSRLNFGDPYAVEPGTKVLVEAFTYPDGGNYVLENIVVQNLSSQENVEFIGQKSVGEITTSAGGGLEYSFCKTYYAFEMPDSAVHVTVNLSGATIVSITAGPDEDAHGSVTISPAGISGNYYKQNTPVTITATAAAGYAFKEWQETGGNYLSDEQKTQSQISFVVGGTASSFTAVFEPSQDVPHTVTVNQPETGGTIQASHETATKNTVVTLTATPLEGFQLQQWVVRDESGAAVPVTPSADSANQATFTMPDSNVTVTAEFVSSSTALPTISNVELLHNGSPIGTANLSGTTWTITLPADTDQSILDNITSQYLRITHNGASVAQSGGTDDANTIYKWADGNVMCNMTLNTPYTFTVRSADGATQVYTITIQYTGGSSGPILTAGAVNRTGDATATVTFTTSASGRYYTSVVVAGAAAPTIDTAGAGVGAVQGSNTISLTNLTTGAKDLYIVVKDESGAVSQPLKVEIPAYSAGMYTITINAPAAGGTIVPSKTTANAGETITLSVVPNTGYQMVAGSLTYTQNVAGSSPVAISNFQFTMPAANVTVTCQWETATTVSGGITSFIINGISGVINQATGTITVTLPYGTSVNRLTPVIATANVVSLSPSSGTSVNFNRPVTYTARMTDGTIKTYVVTVYVQLGSTADEMWEDLIDFYDQIPWWEYAERQQSRGRYPRYW